MEETEWGEKSQDNQIVSTIFYSIFISNDKVTYIFAHVKKATNFMKMCNATLIRLSAEDLNNLSDVVLNEYPYLWKKLNEVNKVKTAR